jgi:hypothetical protein
MKHLLNDLSSEEKNNIRKQHTGGKQIDTSRFKTLSESKSGDVKPILNEAVTGSITGGFINVTNDKGKTENGCVKFTRYDKTSDGKWEYDQDWAQGLFQISKGQEVKGKFDFSAAIRYFVPDDLEKITLSNKDLSGMYYNWSIKTGYQKTIYAKDGKLVSSENGADMKFILTFGGPSTNKYCISKWS